MKDQLNFLLHFAELDIVLKKKLSINFSYIKSSIFYMFLVGLFWNDLVPSVCPSRDNLDNFISSKLLDKSSKLLDKIKLHSKMEHNKRNCTKTVTLF